MIKKELKKYNLNSLIVNINIPFMYITIKYKYISIIEILLFYIFLITCVELIFTSFF